MDIKDLKDKYQDFGSQIVELSGWVRNRRSQKEFGFIDMFDGTTFGSIQVVYDEDTQNFVEIQKIRIGSAIKVSGEIVLTPNMKQAFEVKAKSIEIVGTSEETYPIQPKRHTREFLRSQAHLRARTLLFNSVFRVRHVLSHAIHQYFHENGFIHCPAPILTANDAEGAGETFTVTTLPLGKVEKVDFNKDFFGKKTNLSVTGQLEAEIFAMSFKKTYTFGPTFRAENSNTKTHASEFWMIEPEMAFADLSDLMMMTTEFIKYIVQYVLDNCKEEMEFFDKFVEKGLLNKLHKMLSDEFKEVKYSEAIDILQKADVKFENEVIWGNDLATEHEKYLTSEYFSQPIFITDWPKEIKSFYMKVNEDGKTVRGMDLLMPRVGEMIGGSQREENYDILRERMIESDISPDDLWWYLELRKYGGCVCSGFGLGLDRMIMYLTGIENIRDVQPFARTPKNCEF